MRASIVVQKGSPRRKCPVPSIGSTSQKRFSRAIPTGFFPDKGDRGIGLPQRLGQERFDAQVEVRDHIGCRGRFVPPGGHLAIVRQHDLADVAEQGRNPCVVGGRRHGVPLCLSVYVGTRSPVSTSAVSSPAGVAMESVLLFDTLFNNHMCEA
jgi:hypothetical protein